MTSEDKSFVARWSRRKQAAREGLAEPEHEDPDLPDEPEAAEATTPEPGETNSEDAFADVDFEALDYSSDYTRFMGKDVPEMVQRRALRALWRSDPVLANIDGLNDYDEDFTDAATVVENLVSAYRAGHGYRTDEEIAALEAEETEEAAAKADAGATESAEAEKTATDEASREDENQPTSDLEAPSNSGQVDPTSQA